MNTSKTVSLIELKDICLINESFKLNSDMLEGREEEIKNILSASTSIGIDEDNKNDFGFKLGMRVRQCYNSDIEDENKYISILQFEYICSFLMDEQQSNEYWELLKTNIKDNKHNKDNDKLNELTRSMLDSVYPYMKDHIESIYKKANITINIPFKVQL